MIRRGKSGGVARGAAFIAFMVARVAYFPLQDGASSYADRHMMGLVPPMIVE